MKIHFKCLLIGLVVEGIDGIGNIVVSIGVSVVAMLVGMLMLLPAPKFG